MKNKGFLAVAVFLALNSHVLAGNVSLNDLQNSQAHYVPAINTTSKDFDRDHWAYQSLENITKKYGLLVGEAGDKFDGYKPLTRNEAAVILVNLIGKVEQERINIDDSEKTRINILKNELSSEITALTGRVATLEQKVDKLQGSITKVQDSSKKSFKYGFGEDFKIGGGMQIKYNGIIGKGADNSSFAPNFSIPTSDLRISGKMAPHLNYLTQINPNRTWSNSVSSTTTSPAIGGLFGDAYVSTDIIPHNTVMLGQTRIPIGIEGTLSPYSLNTIDRSQVARSFSDYRDMGVKVAGTYPLVDYYAGVYNGSGMNYKDYSSTMGGGGWLVFKPLYKLPKYGKFDIGGGYYRQMNGNTTNTTLASRFETQTYGFNLGYKYKKHGLKSEYLYRKGYSSQDRIAKGIFAEYTYDLTPKIQLLTKYDTFDPNQRVANDLNTEYTLGMNYFVAGTNIKLQLDGVYVNNKSYTDSFRVMALTQFVF